MLVTLLSTGLLQVVLLPHLYDIYQAIKRLVSISASFQSPVVMEPVWKTRGKSPQLANDCLGCFCWSNCGLLNLFMPSEQDFISVGTVKTLDKISRHTRHNDLALQNAERLC